MGINEGASSALNTQARNDFTAVQLLALVASLRKLVQRCCAAGGGDGGGDGGVVQQGAFSHAPSPP